MVRSVMYCSEQIIIPENFPNILKTYAKSVIRTQPYDLLRWSAAYFRCLSVNAPPPAKVRLEKDSQCGTLTRGYLRVLLEQIGKGFFVSREVLQKKWQGLCLPEEDLFKYLSLCRMFTWSHVHWLKLFAVMVGSLNKSFSETLIMLCELLTDDVEGGLSRIPMWMFRICYIFVAELDCSEEQKFINGRKELASGSVEDEVVMDAVPKFLSATSMQQALLDEWKTRFGNHPNLLGSMKSWTDLNYETVTSASNVSLSSDTYSESTSILSDQENLIRNTGDFESLILLLSEIKGGKLREYKGPHFISDDDMERAKNREISVEIEREKQSQQYEENLKKYLQEDTLKMFRELGPPWSWIYQFTASACEDQSYNYLEMKSIKSDSTLMTISSGGNDSLISRRLLDEDIKLLPSSTSTSSSNMMGTSGDEGKDSDNITKRQKRQLLDEIMSALSTAESNGTISVSNVSSVVSFLQKDELVVLQRTNEPVTDLDQLDVLRKIMTDAESADMKFRDIDHLLTYLRSEYLNIEDRYRIENFGRSGFYKSLTDKEDSPREKSTSAVSLNHSDSQKVDEKTKVKQSIHSIESLNIDKAKLEHVHTAQLVEITLNDGKEDAIEKVKIIDEKKPCNEYSTPTPKSGPIEETFNAFEPDLNVLAKKISDVMILGVVEKPPKPDSPMPKSDAESTITPSMTDIGQRSHDEGNMSDKSSKVSLTTQQTVDEDEHNKRHAYICGSALERAMATSTGQDDATIYIPMDFTCVVPICPGIGGPISEKTIQDFLTYLKFRSRTQKGMVAPKNFKEDKCPNMSD